ncbi:hypothetical protein AB7W12_21325, partial [Providencia rettgeri]
VFSFNTSIIGLYSIIKVSCLIKADQGNELTEKAVERAVQLSAEKYCSVALMLEKTVEVTHSFEIKN